MSDQPPARRARVLANLALDGLGLEIGPSFSPIAAGEPGLRVRTLDHLDQAGLIEKYRTEPVDISRIQPVDYVWTGQRYADLVGETRFDWIVASHVIEHVPDLVGFVNECAEILTPGGVLSLVVPDKRYEFDYFRPPTGLARLVDAHAERRRRTSPGSAAEQLINQAELDGRSNWGPEDRGHPRPADNFDLARFAMAQIEAGEYVDMHAWVFTPHSFRLAIHDLHALGLLQLQELGFHGTQGCEFYVQLSRAGDGRPRDRAAWAAEALAELSRLTSGPDLAAENTALRRELDAVRRSSSWRITAPLRAIRRLF